MCFLTAHLAAGFANYEERNRDYHTISRGLRFPRNRRIKDHDTIIWLGDFNYRIGLSDEKVHRLVSADDLETLYQNDQVVSLSRCVFLTVLTDRTSYICKWLLARPSNITLKRG